MDEYVTGFTDMSPSEQKKALDGLCVDLHMIDDEEFDLDDMLREGGLAVCSECAYGDCDIGNTVVDRNAFCEVCCMHLCSQHAGGVVTWYRDFFTICGRNGSVLKLYSACTNCQKKYDIEHIEPSHQYKDTVFRCCKTDCRCTVQTNYVASMGQF